MKLRPIAIYLPQFHPIPENDAWWGKGFTEWTNVTKAKPLFKNHYQPHLPANLGFYDLRVQEVREAQARLAKEHGIYGFCYYHYWFNGKRILERPFNEVFESGKPDFPFMLCWANENWTRAWDGENEHVLLEQKYSAEDDRNHIKDLIPYFKDHRYIRINNKPVVAIYCSTLLPDVQSTLTTWRNEAAKQGMELYICRFESHHTGGEEYLKAGFDAAIDFQPWGMDSRNYHARIIKRKTISFSFKAKNLLYKNLLKRLSYRLYNEYKKKLENEIIYNYRFDYNDYVNFVLRADIPAYKRYPCLMPMWDNSPRRAQHPAIFYNSTPQLYKKWLQHIVSSFKPFSNEENLLFINAWNEWGEGNHLEPCMKWGMQYLETTKEILCDKPDQQNRSIKRGAISSGKVSVIIPNYNHERFLKERLDSVFNQSYQNYEVIILDDGSDDNSRSIIEQYRDHEKVTHIVYNETNSGSAFKQWKHGMQYATGEYIWIAESDDWCERNFLETLVNGMEQNPHCSIAYAQSVCVDRNKNIQWDTYHKNKPDWMAGKEFVKKHMLYRNCIVNASMAIFKKSFYDRVSSDFTSFTYCGDWLFWIELACLGNVYISNESLNYFRKHDNDVTGKALASGVHIIEEIKLLTSLLEKKIITLTEYRVILFNCYRKFCYTKDQYKQGSVQQMLNAFMKLFKNRHDFEKFVFYQKLRRAVLPIKKTVTNAFK